MFSFIKLGHICFKVFLFQNICLTEHFDYLFPPPITIRRALVNLKKRILEAKEKGNHFDNNVDVYVRTHKMQVKLYKLRYVIM